MIDIQAQRDAIVQAARELGFAGTVPTPTHTGRAVNPFCGDEIEVYLEVHDNIINVAKAQIKGCLVTQAAWNLLAREVQSKSKSEAVKITQQLRDSLDGTSLVEDRGPLQKLLAFRHPSPRKKCAGLAPEALLAALTSNH